MDVFSVTPQLLRDTLGIELWRVPIVIASAIIIYLVLLLLLRLFGAPVLSGLTGFDIVVSITLGAVAGRVILGHPPTLTAGIIGLVTLLCCEALFGLVRSNVRIHRSFNNQSTHVLAPGQPPHDLMRKAHVTTKYIMTSRRRERISNLKDDQYMILETRATM